MLELVHYGFMVCVHHHNHGLDDTISNYINITLTHWPPGITSDAAKMSACYTLVPVPLDTYNTCTYGHAIMYNSIINIYD